MSGPAQHVITITRVPKQIHTAPEERGRLLKLGKRLGKDIDALIGIVTPATFHRWVREEERGRKRVPADGLLETLALPAHAQPGTHAIRRSPSSGDPSWEESQRLLASPYRTLFVTMRARPHCGSR
ncbi:MAG: hypothetical protein GY903_26300 [Fuerstiella sp.]|nr:hypothetical protein [Fuerstiella sp.]MCP4858009.1 hypothetical protein [Fuerstiella sp.]